jgi:YVTN family beta-propeller protein
MLIDSTRNVIYISRLYKSSIMILNLQTLATLDSIGVGANPQQMALAGGRLYVCNSGYGADNRVTVINPDTRAVVTNVRVGDGPTGIVLGPDGKLWVACTGNAFGIPASSGSIHLINPSTNVRMDSITFTDPLWGDLVAGANGYVYALGTTSGSYYGGPVHRIAVSSLVVSGAFIAGTYYGIGIDDATGDLYLGDAKSFAAPGEVRMYTADGALKKTFTAERGPTLFMFKR